MKAYNTGKQAHFRAQIPNSDPFLLVPNSAIPKLRAVGAVCSRTGIRGSITLARILTAFHHCYSLDLACPPMVHVVKAWSPPWWYREMVEPLGGGTSGRYPGHWAHVLWGIGSLLPLPSSSQPRSKQFCSTTIIMCCPSPEVSKQCVHRSWSKEPKLSQNKTFLFIGWLSQVFGLWGCL